MKAKKALRRLTKVETLLSNVIDQFPLNQDGLGDLLDSAKTAVARARKTVKSHLSSAIAGKLPASTEGRKKVAVAARRRVAATKRKGMTVASPRRLRKTA